MEDLTYSLREAARRGGVPEERLRRAILLGELIAEPIPDGREYLIRAVHLESFLKAEKPTCKLHLAIAARRRKAAVVIGFLGLILFTSLGIWILLRKGGEFSYLPRINGINSESYKVVPYMQAAVHLQAMGRGVACLTLLKAAAQAPTCEQDEQIIVLCRMLFTKRATSEFSIPALGAPCCLGGTDYSDWPLEPMELVDGVPFLITRGYKLGGEAEPACSYVRYCIANCDWNTVPFREPTAKQMRAALDKLLASGKWKRPLDSYEREFLAAQIE
jgi:hypothetical protein